MRCVLSKYEPAGLLVLVYETPKINVTDQSSFKSIAVKKRNQTGDMMKLGVVKKIEFLVRNGTSADSNLFKRRACKC
jgi:hypothetical protein